MGDPGPRPVDLLLSRPARSFGDDDPIFDFLVTARGQGVSVEVSVRTLGGDGLDAFLSSLAEDFRGWTGARTWRSLEGDLSLSAEHGPGGYVRLTWGIHDRPPSEEWHFETATVHAPGEEMRNLAAEIRTFVLSAFQ
nr:DUF6228 family protein [Streptomyces roseoverticillatus]